MNYVIFDTETTSLNSPFCYNIGYVIINELGETLLEKEYIVEQIWHNIPLFSTSYYAEKRPIYVQAMRQHKIKMDKFGYICQAMKRDFKKFHVAGAYAYNSNFDEKVFDFNCDWFKCINPFEEIHIMDIRGNVHEFLFNEDYKRFCNNNQFYTDSGCYSSTAEIVYRYITNKLDFIEAHTALSDSLIEKDILLKTIENGAEWNKSYKSKMSLGSPKTIKTLVIQKEQTEMARFEYERIIINKDKTRITLK